MTKLHNPILLVKVKRMSDSDDYERENVDDEDGQCRSTISAILEIITINDDSSDRQD